MQGPFEGVEGGVVGGQQTKWFWTVFTKCRMAFDLWDSVKCNGLVLLLR